ncbi:hypothetical protein AnigIFM63309_011663 [Aspergillus niger]|nr:hypothetical protein AnigIFM63309_011663 [Aspergillus niger]
MNRISFSEQLGFVTQGKEIGGLLAMITAKYVFLCYFSVMPHLGQLYNYAMGFRGGSVNPLVTLGQKRLLSRWDAGNEIDDRDLLSQFIKMAKQAPEEYNQVGVLGVTLTIIGSGSGTTGYLLAFLLRSIV